MQAACQSKQNFIGLKDLIQKYKSINDSGSAEENRMNLESSIDDYTDSCLDEEDNRIFHQAVKFLDDCNEDHKLFFLFLMETNAKRTLNLCNKKDETPISSALIEKKISFAQTLLENGSLTNVTNKHDEGLAHLAIKYINDEEKLCKFLNVLMNNECNVILPNAKGETPFGLACKLNKEKAAEILKNKSAPPLFYKTASLYFADKKNQQTAKNVFSLCKFYEQNL